jgi:hypothetical protein
MKRLIATVSFAVFAAPVLAQSTGPTSPIGPSWVFGFGPAQEATQVASSGATRSDVEIAVNSGEARDYPASLERQPGYFDPSN